MNLKANLDKFASTIVSHAKEVIVALHGEQAAKDLLPQLGNLLKAKVDSIILKAEGGSQPKA